MTEKSSHRPNPQKSLYSGLIICADCGVGMFYWNPTNAKKAQCPGYQCRAHSSTGGTSCSSHRISEKVLKRIILNDIRGMAQRITLDENEIWNL